MVSKSFLAFTALAALAVAAPVKNSKAQQLDYPNIDQKATPEAKSLLKYIQQQYGNLYISGQEDAQSVAWVKTNLGVTPAIQGNDFMDYSLSRVAKGAKSNNTEDALAFDKAGGMNAFVWHWNAPSGLLNTASEPWYSGFYTKVTSFNLQTALAEGPNGANYKALLNDIDAIAAQIKRLSDANVPFLWRPLHEPDGAWFWWGAHGAAPFLQLWDILYDRLTNYHDLHNMVWVCNTAASGWYPGNDKCDIATVDIYGTAGDNNPDSSNYQTLKSVTSGQRVLALAEVGEIPDPKLQASSNTPWAYWSCWSGEFIENGSYNQKSFLKTAYSSPNVITLDGVTKLGKFKQA